MGTGREEGKEREGEGEGRRPSKTVNQSTIPILGRYELNTLIQVNWSCVCSPLEGHQRCSGRWS